MKWGIVFSSTVNPDPDRAICLRHGRGGGGVRLAVGPEHVVIPEVYVPQYMASSTGKMDQLARSGVPDPLDLACLRRRRHDADQVRHRGRHPPGARTVAYAKTVATLASLTRDRFMLGVGVGWCREEYDALQMPWEHRGSDRGADRGDAAALARQPGEVRRALREVPRTCTATRSLRPAPSRSTSGATARRRRCGPAGWGTASSRRSSPRTRVFEDLPGLIETVQRSAREAGARPDTWRSPLGGPHGGGIEVVRGPGRAPADDRRALEDGRGHARGAAALRRRGDRGDRRALEQRPVRRVRRRHPGRMQRTIGAHLECDVITAGRPRAVGGRGIRARDPSTSRSP